MKRNHKREFGLHIRHRQRVLIMKHNLMVKEPLVQARAQMLDLCIRILMEKVEEMQGHHHQACERDIANEDSMNQIDFTKDLII